MVSVQKKIKLIQVSLSIQNRINSKETKMIVQITGYGTNLTLIATEKSSWYS